MILEYVSNRPEAKELQFGQSGITGFFRNTKYKIMGARQSAYTTGAALVLGSVILFVAFGFKLGVDFQGGRQFVIEFEQPVDAAEVKDDLTSSFNGKKPVVRTIGGTNQLLVTTNYLADDAGADKKVRSSLNSGLSKFGEFEILRNTKVGPTIANDIRKAAVYAVIISLLVIFLYIFARFQRWQFGLSALVSLALNVTVVLGVFSLLGSFELMPFSVEINQPIIAALLTIVGYTINDTVVVFDRIRENMRNDKIGSPLPELYNKAVNETLARTLVTSVTTLLTAFILFIFGGEALKSFMLALILGIAVGTLSSIFVASPLSMDLLKSSVGRYNPDAPQPAPSKGGKSPKSSGTKKGKSTQQKTKTT
jgi:SecD/SecF fusion protein